MKRSFTLFFFSFFITGSFAGNEDQAYGARSAALGNASVTLADPWSVFNNQAGLGFVKKAGIGICYEDRFLMKELGIKSFAFALPVKGGTFGLSCSSFGYSAYGENKYGLGFGKAFGENISAGVQMDYLQTRISEGYGTKGSLVAEAGLQFRLLKNLTIGTHLYNITRTKLADYNAEKIPTVMRIGLNYKFSEKVFIAIESEKNMDQKVVFRAGAEYMVAKILYLRAGIASNPSLSSFGIGLHYKGLKLEITSTFHPVLGMSPQVGLGYDLK